MSIQLRSMVSIAESGGSQDEIIDADFSPKAVACYATPESSPQGIAAATAVYSDPGRGGAGAGK